MPFKRFFAVCCLLTLCYYPTVAKSGTVTKKVIAIYQDCTVYTGYTGYFFKDKKTGKKIQIQVVNDPENKVTVPKDLIEDTKDLEGLPGANPKMVGKAFEILYFKDETVIVRKVR